MALFSFFNRKSVLSALADLDDRCLSDIGLNRYDLNAARRKGASAAAYLSDRRAERAAFWLR